MEPIRLSPCRRENVHFLGDSRLHTVVVEPDSSQSASFCEIHKLKLQYSRRGYSSMYFAVYPFVYSVVSRHQWDGYCCCRYPSFRLIIPHIPRLFFFVQHWSPYETSKIEIYEPIVDHA